MGGARFRSQKIGQRFRSSEILQVGWLPASRPSLNRFSRLQPPLSWPWRSLDIAWPPRWPRTAPGACFSHLGVMQSGERPQKRKPGRPLGSKDKKQRTRRKNGSGKRKAATPVHNCEQRPKPPPTSGREWTPPTDAIPEAHARHRRQSRRRRRRRSDEACDCHSPRYDSGV